MANATPRNFEKTSYSGLDAVNDRTSAVLLHAVDELKHARELAERDLQAAIAGFREIFVNVAPDARGGSLLRQAWAVHQALEVVRSLDRALGHLDHEPAEAATRSLAA